MKVLSILLLGLVLFGFNTAPVAAAATDFYVIVVEGINNCLYHISLTSTGLKIKRLQCWNDALIDGDLLTTALVCDEIRFDDTCYIFTIVSDSSGGSTRRSVLVSGLDGERNVVYTDLLPNVFPGSAYALHANDLVANPPGQQLQNGLEAAFNRLFIAGNQGSAGANDYFAFALTSDGLTNGAKSTIFSNPNNKFALGGSMSRDGRMAVQLSATSSSWNFSTRVLKDGVPAKAPSSWTVPAYHGYSPDITNQIEVNSGIAGASALKMRYLVYRAFKGVGTSAQQSQIMVQRIDDATGKPLETAKPLTPFKNAFLAPTEAFQSLAISPGGEVLVFTEYSSACKKMILKSLKLVNGVASGAPKLMGGCGDLTNSRFGFTGADIAVVPEFD